MSKPFVIAAMSGGVDSSLAALLLKRDEYPVAGMFMKNWEEDDRLGACPAEQDAADALAVCERIGIRLLTRNFSAEYWDQVFEHFLNEYRVGRTPNPDILCNREIKFKTFLEHAQDQGAELIATGHYVRRGRSGDSWELLRGLDRNKDQSYFLYTVGQEQLRHTLFPVGELSKPQVRQMARDQRLPVHAKKDSTGICFIGERNFKEFLSEYLPAQPGDIKTPQGDVLGQHDGLMYYTLGQRQGLGIGGRATASGEPWYVLHKDLQKNVLYVGQGHDHPLLFATKLSAREASWVAGCAPAGRFECSAKTRYRQADQECTVEIRDERVEVSFRAPQRAVTPGQSVVFYHGEVCLGGAVIQDSDAPLAALAAT